MHHRKQASSKGRRAPKRSAAKVPLARPGTLNRPPDNSGTIQIPRPITVKASVQKRSFKIPVTLTTPASGGINNYFCLYSPFSYATNGGSTLTGLAPASYNNMIASFGAFKPKKIQLIFEPLLPSMSAVVPVPYTVVMAPDLPNASNYTLGTLDTYQNSTKISPFYPTEITYIIPKLASGQTSTEVLSGGWILTEDSAQLLTSGGVIVFQPSTMITASTPYSQLTLVYEVWFKNPL